METYTKLDKLGEVSVLSFPSRIELIVIDSKSIF